MIVHHLPREMRLMARRGVPCPKYRAGAKHANERQPSADGRQHASRVADPPPLASCGIVLAGVAAVRAADHDGIPSVLAGCAPSAPRRFVSTSSPHGEGPPSSASAVFGMV